METTEALYSAAVSTFESLAFAFADGVGEDGVDGPIEWAGVARVSFAGPWAGALRVRLDGNALANVTANMLGADGAPDATLQRDALGELANVICGNVLPLVAGAQPIFVLDPPAVSSAADAWNDGDGRAFLRIESGFAQVSLQRTTP